MMDTDDIVAEGRLMSSDPEDFVNGISLGPNAVKVLVETAIKPDTFIWRPSSTKILNIGEAVGEIISWPAQSCVVTDNMFDGEDIAPEVLINYDAHVYMYAVKILSLLLYDILNHFVFSMCFTESKNFFY